MTLAIHGWQAAERLATAVAGRLRHDDSRTAMEELRNRLAAFSRFLYAEQLIGAYGEASLADEVGQLVELQPYDRLWVTEGLGYARGSRAAKGRVPILRDCRLPESVRIPLHAGLGLALAASELDDRSDDRVAAKVCRFVDLCTLHASPGYASVTFEALGLAVRGLAPHLVIDFAREIAGLHTGLEAYFWHGVGRGAYFSPHLAATLAPTRDLLVSALAAAPPGEPAANVIAGLSWAVVLVNIRDPGVIDRYLSSCEERELDGVQDGVDRAIQVWATCVGPDAHLQALLHWNPGATPDRWEAFVVGPCLRAFRRVRREQPARWFRYRKQDCAFDSVAHV